MEKFRSSLKTEQKHIEKEIANLTNTVSEISKKSQQGTMDANQVQTALEAIVNRLSTLKRKVRTLFWMTESWMQDELAPEKSVINDA